MKLFVIKFNESNGLHDTKHVFADDKPQALIIAINYIGNKSFKSIDIELICNQSEIINIEQYKNDCNGEPS